MQNWCRFIEGLQKIMNRITNFKDLVILVKEASPASPATPPNPVKSVAPPKLSIPKAAAKTAAKGLWGGAKNLAKQVVFDPKGLGQRIGSATGYDVIKGVSGAVKGGIEATKQAREKQLTDYYLHLAMPNGWPQKGNDISIVTMYHGDYDGKIVNKQKIASSGEERLYVYTIMATPAAAGPGAIPVANQPKLAMVVTIDEHSLPFYAVKKYIVSTVTPDNKYIKNEKESGHLPTFVFDYDTAKFSLDSKQRPDYDLIPVDVSNRLGVGDTVRGIGIMGGQEIIGNIVAIVKRPGPTGKEIELYRVAFIPGGAAATTTPSTSATS